MEQKKYLCHLIDGTEKYLCHMAFPLKLSRWRSDLLVAGAVKEEDGAADEAVEDGEGAVERQVLVVLAEHADHERGEHQRHDDQVRALRDAGRQPLGLVHL